MSRSVLAGLLGGLVLMTVPATGVVHAQCAFRHPRRANKLYVSLVPLFFPCGTTTGGGNPDTTTESGVPACTHPATYDQINGEPVGGWTWDSLLTNGQVKFRASRTFPPNALNPPSNTADVLIDLKLSGVSYVGGGGLATGTGHLSILVRITLDDRDSGDVTTIDFPLKADVPVTSGKALVKTSADAILNDPMYAMPGLPTCSSLEIIAVVVLDQNGNLFADEGLFMP